jgi:phospholipid/cholesterol/gamma-HCH transport system substrate-binding protein
VNRLTATLERETGLTTPALRQALNQLSQTGSSAEQTSRQAQQLVQQSQPLLISTLKEVEELASSSRKILQSLLGLSGADP